MFPKVNVPVPVAIVVAEEPEVFILVVPVNIIAPGIGVVPPPLPAVIFMLPPLADVVFPINVVRVMSPPLVVALSLVVWSKIFPT